MKEKTKENPIDLIIMNGDFIGHDISSEIGINEK
jgi:hypothetical protein